LILEELGRGEGKKSIFWDWIWAGDINGLEWRKEGTHQDGGASVTISKQRPTIIF